VFATGTDEHGSKIQKRAKLEKMECINYCDSISSIIKVILFRKYKNNFFKLKLFLVKYKKLFDSCDVKYTDFIRTTETRHKDAVYQFWDTLNKNGYIYKSTFTGWYSVNDECFLKDDEV
jgi:methionyl-tRNA synthetase